MMETNVKASGSQKILSKSEQERFQKLKSGLLDFLAQTFPCQESGQVLKESEVDFFTVVGLLKSTDAENKPGILIIENVKHLLSSKRGGDFTAVLTNLWEAGYDVEWQCVNSKDFRVPQHRERVYLVGYLGGIRGRKVFPISGSNRAVIKKVIGGYQGERVYDGNGLSVTLTASGGGAGGKTGLYLCDTKSRRSGWSA